MPHSEQQSIEFRLGRCSNETKRSESPKRQASSAMDRVGALGTGQEHAQASCYSGTAEGHAQLQSPMLCAGRQVRYAPLRAAEHRVSSGSMQQ